MIHRLVQVASAVDREASQLLHAELHTIQPSAPQIPLSRLRPVANPAPEVMEKMNIETSLKQAAGPLQSLWEAAIERGKAASAVLTTPTPTPRKSTTSIFEFPRPLNPFRMSPATFGGDGTGTAVLANGHVHPIGNGKVPGSASANGPTVLYACEEYQSTMRYVRHSRLQTSKTLQRLTVAPGIRCLTTRASLLGHSWSRYAFLQKRLNHSLVFSRPRFSQFAKHQTVVVQGIGTIYDLRARSVQLAPRCSLIKA
uniref:Uncharacterized protein n=1 Tax=Mycena chlorophos TaxID=658473 RepID=A0ABQ0L942_MYCCL|nr:predicted protein [Mycena chlorophos]